MGRGGKERRERMIHLIYTTLHYTYRRWGGGIVQITYRGFDQFGYTNVYKIVKHLPVDNTVFNPITYIYT